MGAFTPGRCCWASCRWSPLPGAVAKGLCAPPFLQQRPASPLSVGQIFEHDGHTQGQVTSLRHPRVSGALFGSMGRPRCREHDSGLGAGDIQPMGTLWDFKRVPVLSTAALTKPPACWQLHASAPCVSVSTALCLQTLCPEGPSWAQAELCAPQARRRNRRPSPPLA